MEKQESSSLQMPLFSSEEEKQEYLKNIFEGTQTFPLIAGGMGIDLSNAPDYVDQLHRSGVIPTMSASAVSVGDPQIYEALYGENKIKGIKERTTFYQENNQKILKERLQKAREKSPYGILGINLMRAVKDYNELLEIIGSSQAVDLLFVGAGLPLELSTKMKAFPHMKYIPIVSSARAAEILIKNAKNKKGRLPDAFYIELPPYAGGHLGAKDVSDAQNEEKFNAEKILQETQEVIRSFYPPEKKVPLLLAGGIFSGKDIEKALQQGYQGVSLGTRFLLTQESGLPDQIIKNVYLQSPSPVKTTMESPAGMPSRSLHNPQENISREIQEIRENCFACIGGAKNCQYLQSKGEKSYCIPQHLGAVRHGKPGLYFTGSKLPEIQKDSLYRDDLGEKKVPCVAEVVDFLLRK